MEQSSGEEEGQCASGEADSRGILAELASQGTGLKTYHYSAPILLIISYHLFCLRYKLS